METQNWPYFLRIVWGPPWGPPKEEAPKPSTAGQNQPGCGNAVNPAGEGSLGMLPAGTGECWGLE